MSETLLLRMPEANRPANWLVLDAFGNRMGQTQIGTLTEAASYAADRHLRVCVPGSAVMLLHVDIPSNNAQKILRAVPYALEDKLAEDVEMLHFAVGARDAQGYPVAVVTRTRMRKWLDELAAVGLAPAELLPDALALPMQEHALILVPDDGQLLVRFPDGAGIAAETALVPQMVRRHLSRLPASITCTHAMVYASEEDLVPDIRDLLEALQLTVTYRTLNGGAITHMATKVKDPYAINMLQGEFAQRSGATEHWHRWRITAALLAAFCAALIVQQGMSEFKLRREATSLNDQIMSVFHQALPDVTHMVDPQVQMQQRLAQLNGGNGNSVGLLSMLTAVGDVLRAKNGVQLQSFSYHDGALQLQVQAGSIDVLNDMKNTLAQNSALHVDMDSLNSSSGTTTGRLTISGGGG